MVHITLYIVSYCIMKTPQDEKDNPKPTVALDYKFARCATSLDATGRYRGCACAAWTADSCCDVDQRAVSSAELDCLM